VGKRAIVVYWLMLLLPAAALAVWALFMLRHEEERAAGQVVAAARLRADAGADALRWQVAIAQSELSGLMNSAPAGGEAAYLLELRKRHALVRNVFIWDEESGLLYPRPGECSGEESRFIARYDALFSGRDSWDAGEKGAKADTVGRNAGGWLSWFEENRLYMLGWKRSGGTVFGIELDWPVLLSRLVAAFPQPGEGWTWELVDGAGFPMHRAGGDGEEANAPAADIVVTLDPEMPHWRLVAGAGPGAFASRSGGVMVVGGLMVAILGVSIVLGGGLLAWQAWLQRRDAMRKTSFVSNVSHELKTPLTAIRMYSELLSEGRVKEEEKRRRYLDVISQESMRLTRLVNNVLDFSRLEQGRKTYSPENIDVCEAAGRLMREHEWRLRDAGMEPRWDVSGAAMRVRFDRDALEQILLNLLDNAVKYAAAGGEFVLSVTREGDSVFLRAMDRGPGVSRQHRGRLFEKFFRGDASLSAPNAGCGLGLSIARQLARDLGGDVKYEPREGGGSCFALVMPVATGEEGKVTGGPAA